MASLGNDDRFVEGSTTVLRGTAGDDEIVLSGEFLLPGTTAGRIEGGGGADRLILEDARHRGVRYESIEATELQVRLVGGLPGFSGQVLEADQIGALGAITLDGTQQVRLVNFDGRLADFGGLTLGGGQLLTVDLQSPVAGQSVTVDFSEAEIASTARVRFNGGASDDTFIGSPGNDEFLSRAGRDTFAPGAGGSDFYNFDDGQDRIDLTGLPDAVVREALDIALEEAASDRVKGNFVRDIQLVFEGFGRLNVSAIRGVDFDLDDVVTGLSTTAPVAIDDFFRLIDESASFVNNVITNRIFGRSELGFEADTDPDGDALRVVGVDPLDGAGVIAFDEMFETTAFGGRLTLGADGAITFDTLGDFEFLTGDVLPDGRRATDTAEFEFRYLLDDDDGEGPTSARVSVTVFGENDLPVAVDDSFTVFAGDQVILPVLANDTDADERSTLALTALSDAAFANGATAEILGDAVLFRAPPDASGRVTFDYTVSDGRESYVVADDGPRVLTGREQYSSEVRPFGSVLTPGTDVGRVSVTIVPFETDVAPDLLTGEVVVTTTEDVVDRDPATVSLREALLYAGAIGAPTTIRLPDGQFQFGRPLPSGVAAAPDDPFSGAFKILDGMSVTLLGAGEEQTRIAMTESLADDPTMFLVQPGGALALDGLTLRGGGVRVPHDVLAGEAEVRLRQVAEGDDRERLQELLTESTNARVDDVLYQTGGGAVEGGAISNRGVATLSNVTIAGAVNTGDRIADRVEGSGTSAKPSVIVAEDVDDGLGAAIYNDGGLVVLDAVTVRRAAAGSGSGVYSRGGRVEIADSAFSENIGRAGVIVEIEAGAEAVKIKNNFADVEETLSVRFGANPGALIHSNGATIEIADTVIDGYEFRYADRVDGPSMAALFFEENGGVITRADDVEVRNVAGAVVELAPRAAFAAFAAPLAAVEPTGFAAAMASEGLIGAATLDAAFDLDALLAAGALAIVEIRQVDGALEFVTVDGFVIRLEGADLEVDPDVLTLDIGELVADPAAIPSLALGGVVAALVILAPDGRIVARVDALDLSLADFAALAIDGDALRADPIREIFGATVTVAGGDGEDVVDAGPGAETLAGGEGSDTYRFARGDGADVIADAGGLSDRLEIDGYALADADVSRDGADLTLEFGGGDALRIVDAFGGGAIETFVFDGGPALGVDALGLNTGPVAVDDAASTTRGAPVEIAVLANDRDPDGDPLAVATASAAENGSVALLGDGVVYTPDPLFVGVDRFTYTVSDGRGGVATGAVTVDVSDTGRIRLEAGPDARRLSGTEADEALVGGGGRSEIFEGGGGGDLFAFVDDPALRQVLRIEDFSAAQGDLIALNGALIVGERATAGNRHVLSLDTGDVLIVTADGPLAFTDVALF
ncbi:Ig-like domain-containing protein [Rubrimonas cliftonensis]|uniref:Uncharacterized protein n=1 Tax=Rubrimonas cliftonensis TaxID=89524 RepID=A0A1H4G5E3_9RHOB|nr:Ig-like domain-containing protein [Rubrimonas cliftonensis]SEB04138.1 hypothetical protein SAMN05444370_1365 [Rubrimonas cliftonensis]